MPYAPATLAELLAAGFDDIIDVRSPAEYAEDHIPGAVNLPALSNAERARVGTVYVQESRFMARRMGAALVARNVAAHLEGHLVGKGPRYRPLVYCWRGGQRSGSVATILRQIGWQAETLEDGWRGYRRMVVEMLYKAPFPAPLAVLDGNTGTAKTELLHLMAARGVQVIDLEGLARHRGSLFGARAGGQPSQKAFETALARAMAGLDSARPVVVEAESNKIGDLFLPPALWQAMQRAPRVALAAPLAERAAYLARSYADLTEDRAELAAVIDRLRPYHAAERIETWHALAREGAFEALAAALMEVHYDPRYARSALRRAEPPQHRIEMTDMRAEGLAATADRLEQAVARLRQPDAGGTVRSAGHKHRA
ncbi:tRNA 2-selenouridine(34) synthase MnmH [Alkalilacustris brevis]|uniref:tRNA 2-selenouridine(34) synthase MnmH n=1 Tax=Alkalilacustris brevis TaxID=2026338 RepID=UPI000E0D5FF7|nr:tRNA 2-selenouridine(34) synthase MnmH [Alkalilacustris brevis]